ncbi:MAG: succinate dehydrogenase/fumarate reductase iron-sulfur subunit [Aquificaceae bacterium]|nr:succinate dehydrogenase/fumarate reductase iron-sulfur subunit [Aquificaceae bacterium]MCX7989021.1 succinate dehydrogenase/fumarate reductase iron-sulfur subunit [Aquificaceae bacterium]MDW8032107.1 succinate dehydrogenase/fumarate reductase iron-sulfur subunit [Aquificaceae bacterium]MDW8294392.1 succinate dehydrogenase/fumarate reductase iron-sulfur subunit [Aquificaceae bacterium]
MVLRLKIRRQEASGKAYYQIFEVPYEEGMTLLSALQRIKEDLDPSLGFRQFCRAGICGTCTLTVNGFPKLACKEQLLPYALFGEEILIEPLKNFNVLRDLVVDNESFVEKMKSLNLWIKERSTDPRIPPELSKRIETSADCILCLACQSYCPQVLEEDYAGPLFFAKLYRLYEDPREEAKALRTRQAVVEGRLYHCLSCNKCNLVCPKEVEPATLIRELMQVMDVVP